MKLITNYKDYYDYLISKYGIDEKAVYIRKKDSDYSIENGKLQVIAICGTLIVMTKIGGKFVFGPDIKKTNIHIDPWEDRNYGIQNIIDCHGHPTTLNDLTGNPVSLVSWSSYEGWDGNVSEKSPVGDFHLYAYGSTPKLEDLGLDKHISAEDIFVKITNFLLKEKEVVNNQTNPEKIVSHGFDLKRSFRPKMK